MMRRSKLPRETGRKHHRLATLTIALCGLSVAAWSDSGTLTVNNAARTATAKPATPAIDAVIGNAGNNVSDVTLMQKIRQNVTADKSLSPEAQNVTVIARNGDVTLQGDVSSAPERDAVVSKAQSVAGARNIINQITIAGKSDSDNAVMPYNPAR